MKHILFALLIILTGCEGVSGGPSGIDTNNGNNVNNVNNANNNNDAGWDISYDITEDGMQGCDPKNFTLQASPPAEIYLVIDRSGSMSEPGATPGLTRWQELIAAVDIALTNYEGSIRFGLLIYPGDNECGTYGPLVPIALNNRDEILYYLTNEIPAGGTPTAAALNNAAASLGDIGTIDAPKFAILATDGGPNCNYGLTPNPLCSCSYASSDFCCTNHPGACLFGYNCLDDNHTLDVIENMRTNLGIDTFVIGLAGTSEYIDLLNAMAETGGRAQTGGSTSYYPAENQADLSAALNTIAVSVISCVINLDEPPDFPDHVSVYFDGTEVQRDGTKTNGWDYMDSSMSAIELYGPACDNLRDGDEHTLTATFACILY